MSAGNPVHSPATVSSTRRQREPSRSAPSHFHVPSERFSTSTSTFSDWPARSGGTSSRNERALSYPPSFQCASIILARGRAHLRSRRATGEAGQNPRDQCEVLRRHFRGRRIDELRHVESLVQRPPRDALPRVRALVAPRLLLPGLARVEQRVEVVEAGVEVARRSEHLDRDVRLGREGEHTPVVEDEPRLVVRSPGPRVEPAVRLAEEPAAREPVVRHVLRLRQHGQRVEERLHRHLVVVDRQDPVAPALGVQPGERPVDRVCVRVPHDAIGHRRERRLDLRPGAIVQRDEDLVGDPAEKREHRRHALPGAARHHVDGEAHLTFVENRLTPE